MTELFDSLSVAGETVSKEDRVVYLLASLPECYNILVAALKANEGVLEFEVVTKHILHQERKSKDKPTTVDDVLVSQKHFRKRPTRCNHFG